MRMHIRRQPPAKRNRLHNPPHTPSRQPTIPPHPQVRQQRPPMHQTRSTSCQKLSLPQRQISPQRHRRLIPQRNQPLLPPLPSHQNSIIPPLNAAHIQPNQLRVTNPTPVQQLKDHPIPLRPSHRIRLIFLSFSLTFQRIQHPIHLFHTRHPRQMLRQLRRTHQQRRIL